MTSPMTSLWMLKEKPTRQEESRKALNIYEFTVIKVNSLGGEEWVYRYSGPGSLDNRATSMGLDSYGNLYAGGFSSTVGKWLDFNITKLDTSSGIADWVFTYNGTDTLSDGANAMTLDPSGNIYAAGFTSNTGPTTDFIVMKLGSAVGVEEEVSRRSEGEGITFQVLGTSPLWGGEIRVRFSAIRTTNLRLSLWDLTGRRLRTLFEGAIPSGVSEIGFPVLTPSGVYFLRLEGEKVDQFYKVLLIQ